jgi:hypothetical protein
VPLSPETHLAVNLISRLWLAAAGAGNTALNKIEKTAAQRINRSGSLKNLADNFRPFCNKNENVLHQKWEGDFNCLSWYFMIAWEMIKYKKVTLNQNTNRGDEDMEGGAALQFQYNSETA